jgi:LacI family transcriptional regulator
MTPANTIERNVQETIQTQVENFILGKIESGEWTVGQKIPSERELSIKLEVSRTTVRNAIQALTLQGLFDRRIGQGTFVQVKPEIASTSRESHDVIGYVICKERSVRKPISSEAFYFDIFAGVEEETVRSGRHLMFSYLDDCNPEELNGFRGFLDKVDGLVIEEARNTGMLDLIADARVPAVLIAPTVTNERFDFVTMDIPAGVRKAIFHLRSLGHERIGIVNGPLHLESAVIRFSAWKAAMAESGIAPEERFVDGGKGWSAEAGFLAMEQLVDRCPDLTAVFCANDLLAIGALSALSKRGLRVPDDISVVGFDDSELARHSCPPLTTMKIYSRDMARFAVRQLVDRIENRNLPPVKVDFPIDLVVRESSKEVNEKQGKKV